MLKTRQLLLFAIVITAVIVAGSLTAFSTKTVEDWPEEISVETKYVGGKRYDVFVLRDKTGKPVDMEVVEVE